MLLARYDDDDDEVNLMRERCSRLVVYVLFDSICMSEIIFAKNKFERSGRLHL